MRGIRKPPPSGGGWGRLYTNFANLYVTGPKDFFVKR